MQGYWQSERLIFTGGKAMQRGWQKTLDRYRITYQNKADMGLLTFSDVEVEMQTENVALVVGNWQLNRSQDSLQGRFTLVFRKIEGLWKIVADHSS